MEQHGSGTFKRFVSDPSKLQDAHMFPGNVKDHQGRTSEMGTCASLGGALAHYLLSCTHPFPPCPLSCFFNPGRRLEADSLLGKGRAFETLGKGRTLRKCWAVLKGRWFVLHPFLQSALKNS